ncbi:MAG: hypothetical protein ABSF86_14440 [Steroidobacteraceae bacterium]|jgi:hypothetical protein
MARLEPLNLPAIDRTPAGNGTPGAPGPALGTPAQAANIPAAAAQIFEEADIRPLDIPAALQILLFEVSDALGFALQALPVASAEQAASVIVDGFLQKLPATDRDGFTDPDGLAWMRALDPLQTALQSGMDRASSAIAAWRDVSDEVVASLSASRAIIEAALNEEPKLELLLQPDWLMRPEWLGLAPRIERFRRRRRAIRRRLQDPDYRTPL